ncbi:TlpA family protein disulfide reductase [Litoribacter populi]|uniref:TlpA family protein disulfide reductase n=1 Tax=Litoribacter populi TaxID=2598460 RepID=UPI00117D7FEA|nr:TlpA disulfide reductase family protein [Litoribacter populi]
MKKRTIFFFLALLCLVGSGIYLYGERVAHPDSHQSGPSGSDAAFPGSSGEPAPVVIYGEIRDYDPVEKMQVKFSPILFRPGSPNPKPIRFDLDTHPGNFFTNSQPGVDRLFELIIEDVERPGHIDISSGYNEFLNSYLVRPGDSVMIRIDKLTNSMVFSGPSADLFKCQYDLEQIRIQQEFSQPQIFNFQKVGVLNEKQQNMLDEARKSFGRQPIVHLTMTDMVNSIEKKASELMDRHYLGILDYYGDKIDRQTYQILKANYLSFERERIARRLAFAWKQVSKLEDMESVKDRIEHIFTKYVQGYLMLEAENPERKNSYQYIRMQMAVIEIGELLEGKSFFELADSQLSPELRDRVVAGHLLDRRLQSSEALLDGLDLIEDPVIWDILNDMYERVGTGKLAVDFRLPNDKGDTIALSDLRGKVVLVDYWFTGCSACISLNSNILRPLAEEFSERSDYAMVSISIDRDHSLWKKSLASGKYSPPGAIHLNTGTEEVKNDLLQKYNISGFPHVMLIDKEGRIVNPGYQKLIYEQLKMDVTGLF